MNFLFTTVLVLLLVAPGLVFFRAYHSGRFSIRYSNLTITDQVFRSIVPGLLLQLILYWIIQSFSDFWVRLDVIGTLLLGAKEDNTIREAFLLLRSQLGQVLVYYLCLLIICALLGWQSRKLVRFKKWDRTTNWLRYDNQWYYLLSGEILETSDIGAITHLQDASRIDFVFVDVLMKLEKSNMLYSGILAGYELAGDGGLRTIYLSATRRKQLSSNEADPNQAEASASKEPEARVDPAKGIDASVKDAYYPVDGDLMVIPYSQMLNLNLTYYIDEEDARREGDQPPRRSEGLEVSVVDTESG